MALTAKSLFLYNYTITSLNRSLDFRAVAAGPILLAQLRIGDYSLTDLLVEIKRALEAADPTRTYTVTANRTFAGGTQNRITIATSGSYLDLLFASGPRVGSSVAPIIGFSAVDRVGAVSYQGTASTGTALISEYVGYNYSSKKHMKEVIGVNNESAIGAKETMVWGTKEFTQAEFKFEPAAKVDMEWEPFWVWAINQKPFEFVPEITNPTVFDNVTLETTSASGKGMGYMMKEMLPDFPFNYQTGMIKMRLKVA